MSAVPSKPSDEATHDDNDSLNLNDELKLQGITFASSEDMKDSLKHSNRKIDIWTLTDRLNSLEKSTPIPQLKGSNWNHYYDSIKKFLYLSQTSAAFLSDPPRNRAITMWEAWWVAKLRETAPHVRTAPSDSVRTVLSEIVLTSQAQSQTKILSITARFWTFQLDKNTTLQGFIKEYQKRYQELKEHTNFSQETMNVSTQILAA
ncbi:putative serine threonine protein kinase domain protein [Erysiphe necator]|uniref:Putative serine threonine protein kinase domain protein n=1 Tax=Uncinula necator TaxID=52586 RepID=A0A0B1P316_UNCNE|nr:putative serine threonine protein kinase domain protein [Erysiphe necator]